MRIALRLAIKAAATNTNHTTPASAPPRTPVAVATTSSAPMTTDQSMAAAL